MKAVKELSDGKSNLFHIVSAIANGASSEEEFERFIKQVYPNGRIYRGHTHLRVMPTQVDNGESVYVDTSSPISPQ